MELRYYGRPCGTTKRICDANLYKQMLIPLAFDGNIRQILTDLLAEMSTQ